MWLCHLQKQKFVAASSMVEEVIYVRKFLDNLGFPQEKPTPIDEDNRTCVAWSEGSDGGSDWAKHIDLREHFVHDAVSCGILKLESVASAAGRECCRSSHQAPRSCTISDSKEDPSWLQMRIPGLDLGRCVRN